MKYSGWLLSVIGGGLLAVLPARAQDAHPMMDSEYWVNIGAFFPRRNFAASAGVTLPVDSRDTDFEQALGMKDHEQLGMFEFGWQFGEKWGLSTQYFESQRSSRSTLQADIEWEDVTYEVGASLKASTDLDVVRFVFSRQFRDRGPHSLKLAAGFHYLSIGARLAGEATLGDGSVVFRRSAVSTSAPVPNIGAWYRYSSSERLMLAARVDWLSASVGDISGRIWNVSVSANYKLGERAGLGLAYQYFELSGKTRDSGWRGDLASRFDGPILCVSLFW